MTSSAPLTSARLEVKPPRLLTGGAMVALSLYGVLLMAPVIAALLAVSVLQLSLLTWLIPVATVAAATCFLPFGFGNPHVARLVRSLSPGPEASPDRFIVQVTLGPRLRSGARALIEDADDIGWLSFSESELVFQGDSLSLVLPFAQIRQARARTIGLRGLFLYPCITLVVAGLPNVDSLTFAERSSSLLPASRAVTQKIRRRLAERISAQA
jgi:hypothetical protein